MALYFWQCRETASSIARQRAEIKRRWIKEILAYLSRFLDFPHRELPALDIPANFRDIDNDILESSAASLRGKWGIGTGPMPDLLLEIENRGILVSCINMGPKSRTDFPKSRALRAFRLWCLAKIRRALFVNG